MDIIDFGSWEPIARDIIRNFISGSAMYVKDSLGLLDRVKNPVDFLNDYDDSQSFSVLDRLYTSGQEEWSEVLVSQLEEKLIQECYIFNKKPGSFFDFEEEFLEDHFRVEKKYIYDLVFEYGKYQIIQILSKKLKEEK